MFVLNAGYGDLLTVDACDISKCLVKQGMLLLGLCTEDRPLGGPDQDWGLRGGGKDNLLE